MSKATNDLEAKVKARMKEAKDLRLFEKGKKLAEEYELDKCFSRKFAYFEDLAIRLDCEWVNDKPKDRVMIYLVKGCRDVFEQTGNKVKVYFPREWLLDFYDFYSDTFPKYHQTEIEKKVLKKLKYAERFGV